MPLLFVGGGIGWGNLIQVMVPSVARGVRGMLVMHPLMVLLAVVLLTVVYVTRWLLA